MLAALFTALASVVNIYSFICIIAIFMTWIPGIKFTGFGRFISTITDPFFRIFSKIKFLRIGMVDFSAMVGIGLLSILSSVLSKISSTGRIYFGGILFSIVYMLWNICSTFIIIYIIFILVRLIILIINKGQTSYNSAWNQIDPFIQNFTYKVSRIFVKKTIKYQTSIIISLIFSIFLFFGGTIIINIILDLCSRIPF